MKSLKKDLILYQTKKGDFEIKMDSKNDTFWLTQQQIGNIFDIDQSVVSRHVNNIFRDKEIDQKSNMQKMHIANSDKLVNLYSLDVVLSVGYKTNSRNAILFRKWATKTLKNYLVDGFVINKETLKNNYEKFLETVEDIKLLSKDTSVQNQEVLDLVKFFANTWFSLDAYDKEKFVIKKITKRKVKLVAREFEEELEKLKIDLLNKKEASEFFAKRKSKEDVQGIFGNVLQAFNGKDVYESLEEKAAHMLYFFVKNHIFIDGNKRSGAFAFVWFLSKTNILKIERITPETLTAITVMIAESDPKNKEKIIKLVTNLI